MAAFRQPAPRRPDGRLGGRCRGDQLGAGQTIRRKRLDWASAAGNETTLEIDASTVPGGARRSRCTSSTTSR